MARLFRFALLDLDSVALICAEGEECGPSLGWARRTFSTQGGPNGLEGISQGITASRDRLRGALSLELDLHDDGPAFEGAFTAGEEARLPSASTARTRRRRQWRRT